MTTAEEITQTLPFMATVFREKLKAQDCDSDEDFVEAFNTFITLLTGVIERGPVESSGPKDGLFSVLASLLPPTTLEEDLMHMEEDLAGSNPEMEFLRDARLQSIHQMINCGIMMFLAKRALAFDGN